MDNLSIAQQLLALGINDPIKAEQLRRAIALQQSYQQRMSAVELEQELNERSLLEGNPELQCYASELNQEMLRQQQL